MLSFNSKRTLLLCSFIALLIVSCNNNNKEEPADIPVVAAGLTDGTLNILYTDRDAFNKLKHKVVFSFVFESRDGLTMHGWDDKAPFDVIPEIKLQRNLPVTGVTYSTGTYFGNLVIRTEDVNKIQHDIEDKYNYILFTPNNRIPNHINYKITYTNIIPRTLKEAEDSAFAPLVEIYANPSPPRDYNTGQ